MHDDFIAWYGRRYGDAGAALLATAPADDERFEREPERHTAPMVHSVRAVTVGGQSVTLQTRRQNAAEDDAQAGEHLLARLLQLSTAPRSFDGSLWDPEDFCAPDRPAVPVLLSTRMVPVGGVFVALQTTREMGKGDEPTDWLEWAEE